MLIPFLELLALYNIEQIKVPKHTITTGKKATRQAERYWAQHEPVFVAFRQLLEEHRPTSWLNLLSAPGPELPEVTLFRQRVKAVNSALRTLPFKEKKPRERSANTGEANPAPPKPRVDGGRNARKRAANGNA